MLIKIEMLILEPAQWEAIQIRLREEYPPSTMLIRSRMREELGFTVRRHKKWIPKMDHGYYQTQICLDFYNDSMQSWFQLKYM